MRKDEWAKIVKVTQFTEWVAEPVDDAGDIIDPQYVASEREARAEVPGLFAQYPECVAVEIAKVVRHGSDAEGEIDREYTYVARIPR